MKIAFLGDSITKGIPKVSYFEMLETKIKDADLENYGKGGDTVSSLYRRILRINHLDQFDIVFLFVGVNDIYSRINKQHEFLKTIRRQYWSKSNREFRTHYLELIQYLESICKKVVVIPPLVFGENIDSEYNHELRGFIEIIKDILSKYDTIDYLDIHSDFVAYLKDKDTVDYLPESLFRTGIDATVLRTDEQVDQESQSRGLHLTLDGVHLNSKGATIVSNRILKYLGY